MPSYCTDSACSFCWVLRPCPLFGDSLPKGTSTATVWLNRAVAPSAGTWQRQIAYPMPSTATAQQHSERRQPNPAIVDCFFLTFSIRTCPRCLRLCRLPCRTFQCARNEAVGRNPGPFDPVLRLRPADHERFDNTGLRVQDPIVEGAALAFASDAAAPEFGSSADTAVAQARQIKLAQIKPLVFMLVASRLPWRVGVSLRAGGF